MAETQQTAAMTSVQALRPLGPRPTCLLYCMMPSVGKTQVLAGGTTSLSAKLTHWMTWAAASLVAPRSSSLLTGGRKQMVENRTVLE